MRLNLHHALGAALILGCSLTATSRDYSNWMAELPDEAFVTTLSIPGTHDSATGHGFTGFLSSTYKRTSQTQDKTIEEQLAMGVRAFDFRPGKDGSRIRCYHGQASINYMFDDAIKDLCTWLNSHPDEFLFIHLYKATDNNNTCSDLLNTLVNDAAVAPHIIGFRPDLKVKDMRGKILFLKRWEVNWDSDKTANLWDWTEDGWKDGEHYVKDKYEDKKCRIVMQDKANTAPDNKVALFKELFSFSSSYYPADEKDMVWTINFASAYNGTTSSASTYGQNAAKVLPAIIELLEQHTGPTGIVLMDWVGDNKHSDISNLETRGETAVRAIADNNFKYLPTLMAEHATKAPAYKRVELAGVSANMFRGNAEWMDLNSNGMLDLAIKGRDLSDGWWPKYHGLYNNGSSLGNKADLPFVGSYDDNRSRMIIPIDYNADGHIDMLYACSQGSVMLENDGQGNFFEPKDDNGNAKFTLYGQEIDLDGAGDGYIESRGVTGLMLTADFDMDGAPDILTFTRSGNGTEGTPFMYRNESLAWNTCAFYGKNCDIPALKNGCMALGDFDHDGAPDVVITGVDANGKRQVSICLNRGFDGDSFHFDIVTPEIMQPYATTFGSIIVADLDNDGELDIFICGKIADGNGRCTNMANIFMNQGDLEFTKPYVTTIGTRNDGADWCDINGDGYADIVYSGETRIYAGIDNPNDKNPQYRGETTIMLINQGDGTFHCDYTTLAGVRSGSSVSLCDYNGSGTAAIVNMGYGGSCLNFYEAEGARSNAPMQVASRQPGMDCYIFDQGDGKTLLTWSNLGGGYRYNYVVETKNGKIISAVPVDPATGKLRTTKVDAAPTGTEVTLKINANDIARIGVQPIGQNKLPGILRMMEVYRDENGTLTGIDEVQAADESYEAEYFTLQGVKVMNPKGGLFIERRGNKVSKRYIP